MAKKLGMAMVFVTVLMAACEKQPDQLTVIGAPNNDRNRPSASGRFVITYHGFVTVESDSMKRQVLTVIDTETGKEMLLVQGFGTSDLRQVRSGKNTTIKE